MARFTGMVTIVTGGASGIGRATLLGFAREGARVVVADVQDLLGQEAVSEANALGAEAIYVRTDVSKAVEVRHLVDIAVQTYGRLDVAVNNAGVEGVEASTVDSTEESFDRVIAINLKGVYLGMKHEIPAMLANGGGAIVNVASVAGLVGFPDMAPYVASKHGVIGLTKTAALEFATRGIRINAVAPGVIWTPMVERVATAPEELAAFKAMEPVARFGEPREVADAIMYLASDAASFVTGATLAVDGGFLAK